MPEPTLLGDVIQPAWQALTPEQRTCWHFFAAAHPKMTATGEVRTLYGQQFHYNTNAWLAVAQGPALIAEPPTTPTKPPITEIESAVWPLQALRSDDTTARQGLAYIALKEPNNNEVAIVIRQGYVNKKTGKPGPPRIRHVTVIQPEAAGPWDLTVPEGYFASTGGRRKFSVITGKNAKRRPDKPLGSAIFIDIYSGEKLTTILKNPYGGGSTGSNRPRATQVNPTSGVNHYP